MSGWTCPPVSSLWESGWPVSLGSLWGQCVFSSASHIHQEVFYTLLHGQSSPGYDDSGDQVAKESRVSQEHKITLIPHVFSSVLLPSTVPSVCLPRNPLQRKKPSLLPMWGRGQCPTVHITEGDVGSNCFWNSSYELHPHPHSQRHWTLLISEPLGVLQGKQGCFSASPAYDPALPGLPGQFLHIHPLSAFLIFVTGDSSHSIYLCEFLS